MADKEATARIKINKLLEAGVDYIVIEKLLSHRLPGTGELYIHDWDSRLRDEVTRLAVLTEQKLREESGPKKEERVFQVPPSYVELIQNRVSSGKVVPRDRIELSTPDFSVHKQNEQNHNLSQKDDAKNDIAWQSISRSYRTWCH